MTIVQFLKGTDADYSILSQIDEINFFTFENSEKPYGQLSFEEREEQAVPRQRTVFIMRRR